MNIPPNILKELEEKKTKALLEKATETSAPAGVEKPLSPLIPPYTPLPKREEREKMGIKGEEMGEMAPPPLLEAEPHKPSGGEMFFSYLTQSAVFLAVFLTPLFFFGASDSVNLPKQLLLSTLALVALGAWVCQSVAAGKFSWRASVLQWPMAMMALAVVFSSVFSSSFWVSFLGDTGRYTSAGLSLLAYIVLAVVGMQIGPIRPIGPIGLIWAWLGGVFLTALYGLAQFFNLHIIPGDIYANRVFNSVGSPFALSLLVLAAAPLVWSLWQNESNKKMKILLGLLLLAQAAVAVVVDFRVGWLGLIVSALFLMIKGVMGEKGETGHGWEMGRQKNLWPLGVIIFSVLMWFIAAPKIKDLNFPAEVNPSYRASFDILLKNWKDKPIFGSGLETYPYVYAQFKNASLNQTNYWGTNFNGAVAEAITWATTTGIFGALAWLAFAVLVLAKIWKPSFAEATEGQLAAGRQGLAASWIFILVTKFFYQTPLALEFMFWFLPALFLLAQEERIGPIGPIGPIWSYRFQQGSVKTLAVFFVLLVFLTGALGGLYFSVKRWVSEKTFVEAITLDSDKTKRDDVINGIYAAVSDSPYEVRYFRVLAQALFQKLNDIFADINGRPQAERQPKPEESAQIQNLTIRTVNAVQRAMTLDPQNVAVAVDAAESYRNLVPLVQGADDLAIQSYKKASELEPINPFIKTQLGQLYLIKSNLFNESLEANQELVGQARDILDAALKLNPNYANARYFFALIQDKDGHKKEALDNFKLLQQTNPDNKLIKDIVSNLEQGLPALGVPPKPATPPQSPKAQETKGVPAK